MSSRFDPVSKYPCDWIVWSFSYQTWRELIILGWGVFCRFDDEMLMMCSRVTEMSPRPDYWLPLNIHLGNNSALLRENSCSLSCVSTIMVRILLPGVETSRDSKHEDHCGSWEWSGHSSYWTLLIMGGWVLVLAMPLVCWLWWPCTGPDNWSAAPVMRAWELCWPSLAPARSPQLLLGAQTVKTYQSVLVLTMW